MTITFASLQVLLKMMMPDCSQDQFFDLATQLNEEQWESLVAESYNQNVALELYTRLLNSTKAFDFPIPQKEMLYHSYISNTVRNTLALRDAEIILTALTNADITTVGLKGIYLLEHVYSDIGARPMNDIDLLVKKQDLPKCLEVMDELGYIAETYFNLADENIDTKHVPPMQKPGSALVEVHWTLLEEDEPFTINLDGLWDRALPTRIANSAALSLCVEDLILHLCLHLTYQHYLKLGLRGLMDIALVIHKFRQEIDWAKLVEIARSWGAERVTALTLKLVETQLNIPIPSEVFSSLVPEGINSDLLENARHQLLEQVRFDDQITPDLAEMSAKKNKFSKMKIGLQRVFIPRLALARIYNVPPNSPRIPVLYWTRWKYLIRKYGKTVVRLERGKPETEPARQYAAISNSLHEWMSPHKK